MKYIYSALVLFIFVASTTRAQDTYEAAEFVSSDLNGTARYVGMGGALSALGGDISTISTNPAGVALFRHNEAALSVGLYSTEADGVLNHDRQRMSLDQAGMVFVMDQHNSSSRGLQSINFGVNYVKKRNHLANLNVQNIAGLGAGEFSQTFQIADMANLAIDDFGTGSRNEWPVLADIFAPTFDDSDICQHDGVLGYNDYDSSLNSWQYFTGLAAQSAAYRRATYGSSSQYDFNMSFNISDKYFWGLSLGVYSMNYKRESLYGETGVDGNYYDILNWYDSRADGFDLKFGFICRPFDDSPFRFGITIHTPTWYEMDDVNGWSLVYNEGYDTGSLFGYTMEDKAAAFRYSMRTPWKFGLSLGHTIGKELALGLEYELTDPSSTRYFTEEWDESEYFNYVNTKIKDALQVQHTLKLGAEYKIIPEVAFRIGYNYVSSPIKSNAYRPLNYYYDTYPTETSYINWKGLQRLTMGMGYRSQGVYFDLAAQYQSQEGDFYAFDGDYTDASGVYRALAPTKIKNNRTQIIATLGFTF